MAAKLSGGGGGKFDLGQNSDMNVTPFVDVMLVLLIIFMVVAPLATTSIRIDLPPATPPPPSQHEKPPTFISIQDSGQIYVSFGKTDIRPSSMAALATDLPASLGVPNPTDQRIFIRADRHVRYREFMDVINQLQPGRLLQDRVDRRGSWRRLIGSANRAFGSRPGGVRAPHGRLEVAAVVDLSDVVRISHAPRPRVRSRALSFHVSPS